MSGPYQAIVALASPKSDRAHGPRRRTVRYRAAKRATRNIATSIPYMVERSAPMTMSQAIKNGFVRWCSFDGRAGRSDYWWFVLYGLIGFGFASIVDHAAFGHHALFWAACTLAFLVPYAAVAVRRLHDTGHTGWWLLLTFVPLGNIVLLVWFCLPSTWGPNRFGPMPDAFSDEGVAAW